MILLTQRKGEPTHRGTATARCPGAHHYWLTSGYRAQRCNRCGTLRWLHGGGRWGNEPTIGCEYCAAPLASGDIAEHWHYYVEAET